MKNRLEFYLNIPNSKTEYLKNINVTKEVYSKIIMEYKNKLMKGKYIMKNIIKNSLKVSNGITLIALVITIIVLLILARNQYFNVIWRQFYITESNRC